MGKRLSLRLLWLLLVLLAHGCAPVGSARPVDPWQSLRQPDGSVIWHDEYRFTPPPDPWRILSLDERDLTLALYKACDAGTTGNARCGAMIGYAEEPYGFSRNLEQRAHEFLRRYLWAAQLVFSTPKMEAKDFGHQQVLIVEISGQEPVKLVRMQSRIVFKHRGERVVAFWVNQWRDSNEPFDQEDVAAFDRFCESFTYARPSFYELLR